MLKKARLKVAESIKKIEKPEDWQWKRWLKKPTTSKMNLSIDPADVDEENLFKDDLYIPKIRLKTINLFSRGLVEKKEFERWLRVRATKSQNFSFQIPKTNPVFYNPVKAKVSKNYVPHDAKTTIDFSPDLTNLFSETTTSRITIKEKSTPTYQKFFHEEMENKSFTATWSYSPPEIPQLEQNNKWQIKSDTTIKDDGRLDKFFIKKTKVAKNLLPTGDSCKFIGQETISKYYFAGSQVTNNLLLTSSFTYNVSLLNVERFEVSISDIKFSVLVKKLYDSDLINKSVEVFKNYTTEINAREIKELPSVRISKNISTLLRLKTKKISTLKVELNKLPSVYSFKDQKFDLVKPDVQKKEISIINLLTPTEKPNLKYDEKQFDGLYQFQKKGIDFLINNLFAIMGDEHGLGKTIQVVNALNFLFNKKRIKKVLLVSTSADLGNPQIFVDSRNPEGWYGHFNIWTPDLKINLITDDDPDKNKKWNSESQVFILSYNELQKNYEAAAFPKEFFKKFDCIVLDDFHCVKYNTALKKCIGITKSKYFWILSGILKKDREDEFESGIQNLYSDISGKKMTNEEWQEFYSSHKIWRSLNEEKKELPDRIFHNKWFKLTNEQLKEHEGILQEGEVTIYSTIERGNYYIVRPQIFNILHQLKQLSNFSSRELYSTKAKELLNFVQSTDEKIVVFSQYDKLGLERLEKLFTNNSISVVKYKTGMPETVLENAILDFRNNNAQIFLADGKAIQKKINLGSFSSIIHFDHWWNHNALWQLEDKIDFGVNKNPINVYYYWTEATIEEKIYLKLNERGMFYKNIFENLSISAVADLISVEEWLELFNIKVEETSDLKISSEIPSKIKIVEKLKQDELREISKKLLMKLGYNNTKFLKYEEDESDDVSLATKVVNNKEENILVLIRSNQTTDINTIGKFLRSFSDYRKISKTFVITSGKFTEECRKFFSYNYKEFNLIDGTLLANILSPLNLI